MANTKGITELRNKMSEALFEHKEDMKQETFKTLYETLAKETKHLEPKVWVRIYILCNSAFPDSDEDDGENDFGITMQSHVYHRQVLISRNGHEQIKRSIESQGCCGLVIYDKCRCSDPLWKAKDEGEDFYFSFDLPGMKYNSCIPSNAAQNFVKIELLE